jgi:hypothetical protein
VAPGELMSQAESKGNFLMMTKNLTEAQYKAFVHKGRRFDNAVFVHPTATKAVFDRIFVAAKAEAWWSKEVAYIGNDKGVHYFGIRGYPLFAAVTDI